MTGFLENALDALERETERAVQLRHRIHADPRGSGSERPTAEAVLTELGDLVPEPHWITQGWWTRLGGDGPAIGIRAELDALGVDEQNDVAWRSRNPGWGHVCGHDVHLSALVAATRAITDAGLPVPLLLAFQPREETAPAGAADFVGDPDFAAQPVRAMIGMHLQPRLPEGAFSAVPGAVNAAADEFHITIRGVPGHGAYPHVTRDPIVAAAALVQSLQHVVSRRSDPMDPTVLTIGSIHGGSSVNQIPETVGLSGTLRTFSEDHRGQVHSLLRTVAQGVAAAHDCAAEVRVEDGEPVLVNDAGLAETVTSALVAGGLNEGQPFRSCGADDFAYYGTLWPSTMVFVGVGPARGDSPALHHPRFLPPDAMVGVVARAMVRSYAAVAGAGRSS